MTNRIKQLRTSHEWTLDDLAEQSGIKRGTLNNYENGKTEPKLAAWQSLASAFGVSVSYLQGRASREDGADEFLEMLKAGYRDYTGDTSKRNSDQIIEKALNNFGLQSTVASADKEQLESAINKFQEAAKNGLKVKHIADGDLREMAIDNILALYNSIEAFSHKIETTDKREKDMRDIMNATILFLRSLGWPSNTD